MKRVQQKVHSAFSPRRQRMFLIAAGIALQFAIYVVLLVLFSQYFVYFYWIDQRGLCPGRQSGCHEPVKLW